MIRSYLTAVLTRLRTSSNSTLQGAPDDPSAWGLAALARAEREIGNGETTGNNEGPDLDRYRAGGPKGPWCAALVYHCIKRGWLDVEGVDCPIRRSHNAKELWKRIAAIGSRVAVPLPGDVALWHRGAANARTGHIAIVRYGLQEGVWTSLDGNKGLFPSKVRPYVHELGEAGFLGWARLP